MNVGELVKERGLTDGCAPRSDRTDLLAYALLSFDEERGCAVIDEDKVCDELEDERDINIMGGNVVVDYHGCDFFAERYFQLVVVLRTDNTVLWHRLKVTVRGSSHGRPAA